jgi:hypothetical protein
MNVRPSTILIRNSKIKIIEGVGSLGSNKIARTTISSQKV